MLGGKECFLVGDRIVDGGLDVPDVIRSKVWCCFAMFGLMEARAEVGGAVGADAAVWGTPLCLFWWGAAGIMACLRYLPAHLSHAEAPNGSVSLGVSEGLVMPATGRTFEIPQAVAKPPPY